MHPTEVGQAVAKEGQAGVKWLVGPPARKLIERDPMLSFMRVVHRSADSVTGLGPTLARLLAVIAVAVAIYLEIRLSAR